MLRVRREGLFVALLMGVTVAALSSAGAQEPPPADKAPSDAPAKPPSAEPPAAQSPPAEAPPADATPADPPSAEEAPAEEPPEEIITTDADGKEWITPDVGAAKERAEEDAIGDMSLIHISEPTRPSP